eukprot:7725110-Pyramimonas_sp.AAC.1
MGSGGACDHSHWCLRWSPLWGHEAGTHVITATGAFGGVPRKNAHVLTMPTQSVYCQADSKIPGFAAARSLPRCARVVEKMAWRRTQPHVQLWLPQLWASPS